VVMAERRTYEDALDDYAGGNVDDAYSKGARAGEIDLARRVLERIGVPYVIGKVA